MKRNEELLVLGSPVLSPQTPRRFLRETIREQKQILEDEQNIRRKTGRIAKSYSLEKSKIFQPTAAEKISFSSEKQGKLTEVIKMFLSEIFLWFVAAIIGWKQDNYISFQQLVAEEMSRAELHVYPQPAELDVSRVARDPR